MAFHVACPITCQRICFCTLGFQGNLLSTNQRNKFVEEVSKIEEFIRDPLLFRLGGKKTLQISVPRIPAAANATVDSVDDGEELLSIQNKRAAMQKDAIAASMIAEDYARRFESGNLDVISGEAVCEITGEDQVSLTKIMCRMCFSGENEGSERAAKMLPCKVCGKKYHRNCVKSWAEHRDLFHWNSWSCPSCRICEVCRRAGDPNKFMYCKRCDAAYHCYCQQPPHKNVSSGPYLCPKHTRCHSCGSTVSGCGLSTRWFLSYTCCDACGRLFSKGKYCPVCLKVYRDSESTPMVCCDSCQRWVHCDCDGISDEKYQQFQIDRNLYYKCAACRGDCYQVRGLDDAVQELWRRRDEADQDLIASLRASAGLLSYEEIPSVSPYSDDEDGPIISRSDQSKSLKFSVKGLVTKSTKNSKESGKKSSSKKYPKKKEHQLNESVMEEKKTDETLYRHNWPSDKEKSAVVEEVAVNHKDRPPNILHVKTKAHSVDMGGSTGYHAKVETVKGTKLVIHLGSRSKNVMSSPKSEASSCLKEQDLVASNGSEGTSHQRPHDRKGSSDEQKDVAVADKTSRTGQEKNIIKLGKIKTEITDSNIQDGRRNTQHVYEFLSHENTVKKQKLEANSTPIDSSDENAARNEELSKHKGIMKKVCKENLDSLRFSSVSKSLPKDSKPLLKLKFKNPYFDSQSSWTSSHGEEEKNLVKGQRSKRKRPSYLTEKMSDKNDETDELSPHDNLVKEAMDANWILKRLGKDAIGKRVELHDSSDNTWYRGVVTDAIKGSSSLAVYLDDGRFKTLDLGKQSVRFTSQKHKRTKK